MTTMQKYKFSALFMVLTPFIIITLFVAFMTFGKMIYMNAEYPTYKDMQLKTTQTHNAEILILGDSRIKAGFMPQDKSQLNLSVGGITPIGGYYTLKRYLAHNTPPKVLILSYMSVHYSKDRHFWDRVIKFDYLDFNDFIEVINNANILNQCKTLNNKCKKWDFFLYKITFENFNAEMYNAWQEWKLYYSRYKNNTEIMDSLSKSSGHFFYGRAKGSDGLAEEVEFKQFAINPLVDLYLHKIADLAKEHNIAIFHYQMPFNQRSFEALQSQFVCDYNGFLDSMQEKYGIIALNHIWALPNSDFGDSSHLFEGAPKTTKDILDKITAWEARNK